MGRQHWIAVFGYGSLITVSVLGSFGMSLSVLKMSTEQSVTISFLTLAFAQLWHLFNMRDRGTDILRNEITRNRYAWLSIGFCTLLLLGAVYLPIISTALKLANPGVRGWLLVVIASLIPAVIGQIIKGSNRGAPVTA